MEMMYKTRATLFITIVVAALVYVTYFVLGWPILRIVGLFMIGAILIGVAAWLYREMYREND